MANTRLFAKLRALVEDATNADKKHLKKLRKVLRKLKERQKVLRNRLEEVDNPEERRKIEQEIAVITLQRGKGAEVYKQLKRARKLARKAESDKASGSAAGDDAGKNPGPGS